MREWILKPYLDQFLELSKELSNIKAEVEDIKERFDRLENVSLKVELLQERLKIMDHFLEVEKDNRIWLRSLIRELEEVRLELEAIKLGSALEQSPELSLSEEEEKQLVLTLIRKGAHSPSKLKQLVPFGVGKLYRILDELERDGLVRKIGKKKKRKYVPVEAEI